MLFTTPISLNDIDDLININGEYVGSGGDPPWAVYTLIILVLIFGNGPSLQQRNET